VHRDLAARNLLVVQKGDHYELKVTDFGMSRLLVQDEYHSSNRVMPYRWSALESLVEGIFTRSSDVWSFGVTLWEIFEFGRTPYQELENKASVIDYLKSGKRLQEPTSILCPGAVYQLMLRTWSEDPNNRPEFGEIHNLLKEQLDAEDIECDSHTDGYQED